MTVTVISQSMYFPWIGLFDQIRLADEFIFYDDVQLTRGFYNRVQVAQANGTKFITVPLAKKKQKQLIVRSSNKEQRDDAAVYTTHHTTHTRAQPHTCAHVHRASNTHTRRHCHLFSALSPRDSLSRVVSNARTRARTDASSGVRASPHACAHVRGRAWAPETRGFC